MNKKILVFNDGTGQNLNSEHLSNVAKLYNALPGVESSHAQADKYKVDKATNSHALYFRGVGTEDLNHKPKDKNFLRDLGAKAELMAELVSGSSLKERVENTVLSIENLWKPEDKLHLIGFSRGAASIRIAASYLKSNGPKDFKVDYMLVFDTVYSVLTPLKIFNDVPSTRFTDYDIGNYVERCDHLIAGDEMRDMFPLTQINRRNGIRQILFSGSHSDVGGGNPSSSLSDVSLSFAIEEFKKLEISFNTPKTNPDPKAEIQWDRFNGTGQTHFPRSLKGLDFVIHESVIERANADRSVSIALAQLSTFKTNSTDKLINPSTIEASFNFKPTISEKLKDVEITTRKSEKIKETSV